MITRFMWFGGVVLAVFLTFYGVPRTASSLAQATGITGTMGIDVRYAMKLLLEWWLISSAAYWSVIGLLYAIATIAGYRVSHP